MDQIAHAVEQTVLTTLETVEAEVDQRLKAIDDLDEDELDKLRERRREMMKKKVAQQAEWRANGHGTYQEVSNEKEFFDAAKASQRCVVHFYRPSTWRCEIADKHMNLLAQKHMETRFIKINAEKAPFLVERLRIWMLPTIVLVKGGHTDHSIVGFDEMGGSDEFPTEVLEELLVRHEMLFES